MSKTVCFRCGEGAFNNVNTNTNLKKGVMRRDGFRSETVYYHANPGVCNVIIRTRTENAQKVAAEEKRQRAWWRRLLRKLRSWR